MRNVSSPDELTGGFYIMLAHINARSPRFKLFLVILLLLICGTVIFARWKATTANASTLQQNERMQNIRFTVYDVGIYPQEMEVDAGRLSIVFEDRTGKSTGFVVVREDNLQRVGDIKTSKAHWRTRGEVQLGPGRYRVFDSERPDIHSILIVNP
jgi:hypothetical protein